MGAWGYGAMESDPAYDWIGTVMPPVVIEIDKTLALDPCGDLNAASKIRAAAYLLEQVGYEGVYPSASGLASRFDTDSVLLAHLELAIEKLRLIRGDEEHRETMVDPKAERRAIDRQIRALQRRVKDPSAPHAETLLQRLSREPNPSPADLKARLLSW